MKGEQAVLEQHKGQSCCSHTLVYSCTSPWHHLISPDAHSHRADALFPAPNSQPSALTATGAAEGGMEQPGLPNHRVNVTLPGCSSQQWTLGCGCTAIEQTATQNDSSRAEVPLEPR